TLKPSGDSDIKIEVWLPASGWNGKFEAVGNGGWAGIIALPAMAAAVQRGYATAGTDTGHEGGTAVFALGHPEKLADFGYRAVHEMTVKAKSIVTAYYGDAPKLSYWNGCSSGGREGLKEAQKFPADFDGIVAGAPANYWTHLVTQSVWAAQAVHQEEASFIPPAKYRLIHDAVIDSGGPLQIRRLQGSQLGLREVEFRFRRRACGQTRQQPDQCHRHEPEGLLRPWRQAPSVPRLE